MFGFGKLKFRGVDKSILSDEEHRQDYETAESIGRVRLGKLCLYYRDLGKKRWSWLALVFGVLMGISRIYLVVHFPSDVLAGMITGTVTGMIGTFCALIAPRWWYRWDVFRKRAKEAED